MNSNYAIKPTPEQALRTNRTLPPARLIAALGVMNRTLGAFFEVGDWSAEDIFLGEAWQWFQGLPESLRPTKIGNFEPLKRIEDVMLGRILKQEYWVSRGKRLLGSAIRPWSGGGLYCGVSLILELKPTEGELSSEVYALLKRLGSPKLSYMAQVDNELFLRERVLHQLLNCGLVEQNISIAAHKRESFLAFEMTPN